MISLFLLLQSCCLLNSISRKSRPTLPQWSVRFSRSRPNSSASPSSSSPSIARTMVSDTKETTRYLSCSSAVEARRAHTPRIPGSSASASSMRTSRSFRLPGVFFPSLWLDVRACSSSATLSESSSTCDWTPSPPTPSPAPLIQQASLRGHS